MTSRDEVRCLLREAAWWRLASLLMERPRPGWRGEVGALAIEPGDREDLIAAADAVADASEGDYLAFFGPGGRVSPREVAHAGFLDPGRILAGLSGFYTAFAFRPRAEDPPDHVAVEAGFTGYLALKEAYALRAGDAAARDTTRQGREAFLERHLGPFAAALAGRLDDAAPPHLRLAARAIAARTASHAGRAREAVAHRPSAPTVPGGPEPETPFDCGGGCAEFPDPSVG